MKKKQTFQSAFRNYMRMPLYLIILLVIFTVGGFMVGWKTGIFLLALTLTYLLVVLLIRRIHSASVMKELIGFAESYSHVEGQMLSELELPYALLKSDGKILWGNPAFWTLSGKESPFNRSIESLFPEIKVRDLFIKENDNLEERQIQFQERVLRASIKKIQMKDLHLNSHLFQEEAAESELLSLCFFDETELNAYIQKNEDEQLVVAMAYLDNYDEALQSLEDVRRSLLTALIDRKLSKYFSNFDGIVRKLEKDKYFLIMKKNSLDMLKEQKFHILDEVKAVNIGNEMSVTLSMGIGLNGGSYLANSEFARIAIEMALGRGGDQVVVKDGSNISYYGGKSQSVEKNTRVKARVKAQALKEFMSAKDRVVVMGHKITDVDALGAAIGIYRAGKTLGKPVHIVVNDPTTSIRPLMANFIDNPEYDPSMFVDSRQARELVDSNTAVVVVDTNRPSYTECKDLLGLTKTIIVLDHHRRGNEVIENAVLSYVEPYASSTCEMVSEILQYFSEGLKLRSQEADCLYAGIIIDTNNFTSRSGVRTFEAAAFLRRNGADVTRVRKLLRDDINSYKARAEAVRSAEIYQKCFAIGICPSDGLESPTVVGAQAANELLNIAGVKASFVLTSFNGEIFVSARAIDEVNVQLMMEKLGGGGHMNVAGAQVKASVEETRSLLKTIIDESLSEDPKE